MGSNVRVLDSWAIIAFLEGEPSANAVEKILLESLQQSTRLMMTTVNLGEVWYNVAPSINANAAAKQSVRDILPRTLNLAA